MARTSRCWRPPRSTAEPSSSSTSRDPSIRKSIRLLGTAGTGRASQQSSYPAAIATERSRSAARLQVAGGSFWATYRTRRSPTRRTGMTRHHHRILRLIASTVAAAALVAPSASAAGGESDATLRNDVAHHGRQSAPEASGHDSPERRRSSRESASARPAVSRCDRRASGRRLRLGFRRRRCSGRIRTPARSRRRYLHPPTAPRRRPGAGLARATRKGRLTNRPSLSPLHISRQPMSLRCRSRLHGRLPELVHSSSALFVDPVPADVAPAVRLGAVGVGDVVFLRQVVGRERAPRVPPRVGVAGERRDPAPDIRGRLADREPWSFRQRVAP